MSSWQQTLDDSNDVVKIKSLATGVSSEKLRRMYEDDGMSVAEIGNELGCSETSTYRLMDKAGIERRSPQEGYENKKYRNEDWLRRQLEERRRNFTDVGDECGVTYKTVARWADKYNIEKEDPIEPCEYRLSGGSVGDYPVWTATGAGVKNHILVHRLVLVAEGEDPHEIWDDGWEKQVHHRNGFKCDNRPSNLELVDRKTHGKHHSPDTAKWTDDDLELAIRFMLNPQKYAEGED